MADTQPVEVEQLRAQVADLQGQLAEQRSARSARTRSTVSWVLTVLAVLATTVALLSVWTFRTLTVTDLFVDRVGSIIEQPEVAAAVGDAAAAQLAEALELQERIAEALPEDVSVAAGPIANAAENYLAQGATALVETEQFQAAWDAALATGHRVSVQVLSGADTAAVENSDGVIVLNLTSVVNELLTEGADFLSDLLGRDIEAPTVTDDTLDTAVAALEEQLGTDLPADFGQVVLVSSDDLAAAQAAYQAVKVGVWLAPIAALVLIGLAIAVSTRRVRTSLSIVVGTALLLLLVSVALQPLQSTLVAAVPEVGLRGAVSAAFDTVLGSLLTGVVVVVVLGVLAALGLFLSGSTQTAASGRAAMRKTPGAAAAHPGWFLGGGAVVALLLLALIPGRSWGQLFFVLLIYAAYALAVLLAPRVGAQATLSSAPPSTPPAASVEQPAASVEQPEAPAEKP